MSTSTWKGLVIVLMILFLCQAIVGFTLSVQREMPLLVFLSSILMGVLGVAGFFAVVVLTIFRDDLQELKRSNKARQDTIEYFFEFIRDVVEPGRVADVFSLKQSTFDQMSKAQVRFYQQREEKLAAILEEHPDDADMTEYHRVKDASEAEEARLTSAVSEKKEAFWHFHMLVGLVSDMVQGATFSRPDTIKVPHPIELTK